MFEVFMYAVAIAALIVGVCVLISLAVPVVLLRGGGSRKLKTVVSRPGHRMPALPQTRFDRAARQKFKVIPGGRHGKSKK